MKKKLLLTILTLCLSAALIAGATMAWFSDFASAPESQFTAGTLLIDIENFKLATETVKLDILNPGDEWEYTFDVVNAGTKNLRFTGILSYLDILGEDRVEFPEDKPYGSKPLSEVLLMEISVVGQDTPFYSGTLADYDNVTDPLGGYPQGLAALNNPFNLVFGEAALTPEGGGQSSLSYRIKFTLPTTAGNEYQGSQLSLALTVLAKQNRDDAPYGDYADPFGKALSLDTTSPGWARNEHNKANNRPHINVVSQGRELVIEFVNPTRFSFAWDYKVDGAPAGTSDFWTTYAGPQGEGIIWQGDLVGTPFGLAYTRVALNNSTSVPYSSTTRTFTDVQDEVRIQLRRGAEQNWFCDWIIFN